jgi:PKHD-type hydroxylase
MSVETIRYWYFKDIFTAETCDKAVATYTQDSLSTEPPFMSNDGKNNEIDTSIRNVERVILPVYKDLGGMLAAAGLCANNQAWKFNITHANQAEFLKYPVGGRYQAHMDIMLNPQEECRKLSVLVFLNDDFKGGKFYLQYSHKKYYPPQEKGTVLVFPSFLVHGVEDIEEGTRYSAICWMIGPFLK